MNELIKFFTALFRNLLPHSYYGQAIAEDFPRLEYELKQLPVDETYDKYTVTVNIFDLNSSKKINDIVDLIHSEIGRALYKFEHKYIKLYKGDDVQMIPESDKSIHHIRFSLEVRVFYNKE